MRILEYFARNRDAVDSLEGIARWRLLEEQIHHSLQQTEAALRWLLARGFLEEIKVPGSVPLFRLVPNRLAQALRFLEEEDKHSGSKDV
jgi:hypothetical protein